MAKFYYTFYAVLPDNEKSKGGYLRIDAPDFKFAFERLIEHYKPMNVLLARSIDKNAFPKGQIQHLTFHK